MGNPFPVAAAKKAPWLEQYKWKKGGKSPNPLGLKLTYTNRIKELTGGGIEMVDTMVKVMRGHKIKGVRGYLTYNHVLEATKWLAEMVFGKAPLVISDGQGKNYELQKLLYMELVKSGGTGTETYHIGESAILGQAVETSQFVQDSVKDGSPTVQTESNPDQHPERLHRDETDQAHNPQK